MDWFEEVVARSAPAAEPPQLAALGVVAVLAVAAVGVGWWPAWRGLRLLVTLVHELGHAGVGVLAGRRFTGFVLREDMSGHAVTVGRARGPGLVATTWAGYPAPALLGAGLVWLGGRGWASPTLAVTLVGVLLALPFVRSALTLLVVAVTALGVGALWWAGGDVAQQLVLVGVGVVLLVGAWRHLGAVARRPGPGSDPRALASLTGLPSPVWVASHVLCCALATWACVAALLPVLGA